MAESRNIVAMTISVIWVSLVLVTQNEALKGVSQLAAHLLSNLTWLRDVSLLYGI